MAVALTLAGLVLVSLIATGIALVRLETIQYSLGNQKHESLVWTFIQMEREVERVERGLSRLHDLTDRAARAEIVDRFDIALSRVEMLELSPLLNMGDEGARMRESLETALRKLRGATPWFDRLTESAPPAEERAMMLTLLDSTMARLSLVANFANQMNAKVRYDLTTAYKATFNGLIGAVATLLGTLIAAGIVLARQWRGLSAARHAAQAATVAKSAFLATMSHEIRTPMNGVIGSVSLLAQTPLSAEQKRMVDTIDSCGTALLALIDDVLDISRIDSGRVELEDRPFDPRALANSAADILALRARDRGIDLQVQVAPEVPAMLHGDGARLRQVVVNLLSNAVKFTDQGGVALRLEVAGEQLRLSVQDTGIGISLQAQANLFDDFTQADASISRRFGGTGLGLAISRRLVTAMGGTIGVDSSPGQGSLFHVMLPLRPAAPPPAAVEPKLAAPVAPVAPAHPAPPLPPATAPLRVLVAEDTRVNQEVIRGLLEHRGHHPTVVPDGEEAVLAAQQNRYDLVLMDMQMPRLDGLGATRAIRALPGPASRVRIVALTANSFAHDREACLAAGMDGFMAKPITLERLDAALAEAAALVPQTPAHA
ncbi:MAG: ATP-binding protein [Alphaproteobacteria bacterium]|nr:ATP-binding protein [Alphaproteobacteria bacterium]